MTFSENPKYMRKKKLLGQILLEKGHITSEQLEEAIQLQKKEGIRLGEALLKLDYISQNVFSHTLSEQLGLRDVDLNKIKPDVEALNLVDRGFMREHTLIPLEITDNTLTIVMADPLNVFAIDEISKETEMNVESAVSSQAQIERAIDEQFGVVRAVDEMVKDMGRGDWLEDEDKLTEKDLTDVEKMAEEAPIVKLVNSIILEGIEQRASDIHIEPEREGTKVRYRIDGVLQERSVLPEGTKLAVISRIKIMGSLDIAERRIPQDGRVSVKVEGRDVDMRCSVIPTIYGEKIVLRIQDPEAVIVDLDKVGMYPETLERFRRLIKSPHGVFLLTGPTGCGKTSTLYAALREINSTEDNIMTIEDPVEYPIKGINQVQINPKAGLTFATGLRSFLRQDPDKIMVGEIRDLETAEIAVHAALTGHLVFSTLHTNDASGVVVRLTNMGIEPFLVCSSVLGAIAQRLVRTICPECKTEFSPPKEVLEKFNIDEKDTKFYKGKGCLNCRGTGYQGRTAIFEIFVLNEAVRRAIIEGKSADDIRKIAEDSKALTPLRDDGFKKAAEGITTLEEILRVTQEEEYAMG